MQRKTRKFLAWVGSGIELPLIRREGSMLSRLAWGEVRDSEGRAVSSVTMADITNGSPHSSSLISDMDSQFFSTQHLQ